VIFHQIYDFPHDFFGRPLTSGYPVLVQILDNITFKWV